MLIRMDVWERLATLPPVSRPSDARYAVLVPLYEDPAGTVRIVFTRRPEHMRSHPGDVVFPGGGMEGDEGPLEAARREAWEEIRLPGDAVREVLGGLSPITTRNPEKLIVPVVARIDRPECFVPDPAEVESIIEPPIGHLLEDARWRTQDWMGHQLWFYEFEEGILWGATAFMVRELLEYLR
jgi:8-oxo-dGTP pyrophosphatase MutT (NUDIX family)